MFKNTIITFLSVIAFSIASLAQTSPEKPNILFVICDDLNDFIGCYGGHPQAKTPNMDRLAKRGVLFENAAVQMPTCSPSRTSMIYGLYPQTNQYFDVLSPLIIQGPYIKERLYSYIEFFKDNDYAVYGTGKVYHNLMAPKDTWVDKEGNSIYSVPPNWGPFPGNAAMPKISLTKEGHEQYAKDPAFAGMTEMWSLSSTGHSLGKRHPNCPENYNHGTTYASLDQIPQGDGYDGWYSFDKPFRYVSEDDRDLMPDEMSAEYAAKLLKKDFDKPFQITVGFVRPHTPLYAPKKYFDMYPLETLKLSEGIKANDIDDICEDLGRNQAQPKIKSGSHGFKCYNTLMSNPNGQGLLEFTQAYLACVSYVDAQLGKVLDALDASPYVDNTLIIFTSDHGYHIGEKEQIFKGSLWEESLRVPFIVAGPGVKKGARCTQPISWIDIFPTMLDYAGFKGINPNEKFDGPALDGFTIRPLLENPQGGWEGPDVSLSALGQSVTERSNTPRDRWDQHYSVRSERFRYIRTNSGQEELYDCESDPHCWKNIADNPEYEAIKKSLHAQMKEMVGKPAAFDVRKAWSKPNR